ncbi:hypothetical protein [Rhodococcus jostii]|uniref:hypothetical protein n=1 Tax=Rhodococcus jostii TaxID=132919 RepID=UPI00362F3373
MESDIRRYRRRRERRTEAERRRDAERHRLKQLSKHAKEVEDLLAFARLWAPFGGVPEEETFIKFGMRPWRFIERLWQVLTEIPGDRAEMDLLRQAYPPPAEAVTDSDSGAPMTADGRTTSGWAP